MPASEAKQFDWQRENGAIRTYRHMQTGRELYIDGRDRTFHNQFVQVISAKQALDFAMPEGQQHSHLLEIKPERELSIPGYGFGIEM